MENEIPGQTVQANCMPEVQGISCYCIIQTFLYCLETGHHYLEGQGL